MKCKFKTEHNQSPENIYIIPTIYLSGVRSGKNYAKVGEKSRKTKQEVNSVTR